MSEYRKNADEYYEKCGNIVARIKDVCGSLEFENLSLEQKKIINELKDLINNEQLYAEAAFELRKPVNWTDK